MPKYRAYGKVVGSKYLGEFEAENEQEAKNLAMESDESQISFCHQCSRDCEDPEVSDVEVEVIE